MLADVVVFATGFDNDSERIAAEIVGEKVAKELQGANGVDDEGEVRGLFRPLGSEYHRCNHSRVVTAADTLKEKGFWYCHGDLGGTRFFSRFVALQIQADLHGLSWSPYTKNRPVMNISKGIS
jgi:hypothetical protein